MRYVSGRESSNHLFLHVQAPWSISVEFVKIWDVLGRVKQVVADKKHCFTDEFSFASKQSEYGITKDQYLYYFQLPEVCLALLNI